MERNVKTLAELKSITFPKAGCPRCFFYGTFSQASRHMMRKNHLYENHGTYPLHIPDLPTLMAMGYESLPECADCRERIKQYYGGCWCGWQGALPFCSHCIWLKLYGLDEPVNLTDFDPPFGVGSHP